MNKAMRKFKERSKRAVYSRLKQEGETGHIEYVFLHKDDEKNEQGWRFEMKDGRKGKLVLGQGIVWE